MDMVIIARSKCQWRWQCNVGDGTVAGGGAIGGCGWYDSGCGNGDCGVLGDSSRSGGNGGGGWYDSGCGNGDSGGVGDSSWSDGNGGTCGNNSDILEVFQIELNLNSFRWLCFVFIGVAALKSMKFTFS